MRETRSPPLDGCLLGPNECAFAASSVSYWHWGGLIVFYSIYGVHRNSFLYQAMNWLGAIVYNLPYMPPGHLPCTICFRSFTARFSSSISALGVHWTTIVPTCGNNFKHILTVRVLYILHRKRRFEQFEHSSSFTFLFSLYTYLSCSTNTEGVLLCSTRFIVLSGTGFL